MISVGSLIETVLPDAVVSVSAREDASDLVLPPAEESAVARAVASRRNEFGTARHCAREALRRLGSPVEAVPVGERRAPVWPDGVVGSITHCTGFRAAAVAWSSRVRAIGIDAEPHDVLPDGVLAAVTDAGERAVLARLAGSWPDVHWDRVLFSAKESVYKAWFPLAHRWLGFEDAELTPCLDGTFGARIRLAGPTVDGVELREFAGRWAVRDGLVVTSVVLSPRPGEH